MTNLSGANLNNGAAVGPQGEGRESPSRFPTYPAYKNSGVEWLGEVPEHWVMGSLKNMAQIRNGRDYKEVESSDGEYPVIGSGGQFSNATQYLYEGESVLLGRKGTIDKPLYINGRFWTVDTMFYTEISKEACAKFFYYNSLTIPFGYYSTSTALPSMTQADLLNHPAAIPTKLEQTQIARFLDHETARIDALIEEQQRLIELLKEKRQAVISHAVTKGLDPTVPMKDSGVEWLGEVPAHWVKKRLKNISPFITVGIVVNPSDYVSDEGLPFLYGGEVKEGFIEVDKARKISLEDSKKNRKTMLETGDIVTMRVGYPGLTAVVPPECAGGNCASVMLVKRGKYDSHWLCAVMNSRLVRQQVEVVQYGAAQKQFNIADAIEFWMFEPPREEQTMIAEFIDRQSSVFNALMEESESSMQLLQERRSALISATVTGKIDVRGWRPPARTQAPKFEVAEAV